MSETPNQRSTGSFHLATGATLTVSNLPHASSINPRKTSMIVKSLEKKVLEEVDHDEIDIGVNNTELAQEYFKEDAEEQPGEDEDEDAIKKRYHNGKLTNVYESYFKPVVFLKFLVIHALFFCLMGPFIILLAPIFGWNLLCNQGFAGLSRNFMSQSIEYFIIVSFLIVFYITSPTGMQAIEVYMLLIASIMRVLVISSKYAYQTESFLKMMHKTRMSTKEKTNDQLLGRWRLQTDEIIQEEIQSAILRLEIDSPLFFFNFLGQTSSELKNKLMKNPSSSSSSKVQREVSLLKKTPEREEEPEFLMKSAESIRERSKVPKLTFPKSPAYIDTEQTSYALTPKEKALSARDFKSPTSTPPKPSLSSGTSAVFKAFSHFFDYKELETKLLYGYNIAFDLIKNARDKRISHLGKKCLAVSIFRAFIPTFYRIYLIEYKKEDIPLFTANPYVVAGIIAINILYFWANSFILAISVQDFKLKIWCFKQIGYMISPKKIHYFKEKKLYPTLNIFDPISLKTWSSLRRIMKEYGKKYFLRNNLNAAIAMIFYLFMFTTLMLQAFGVFSSYNDPLMFIVVGFETLVYFVIFVHVMMGAAFLNNQYNVHKNLLKKNKNIIGDFQRLSYLYVGRDAIKPDNIIYKEGLRLLRNELGDDNFQEKLVERATLLNEMIDDIIEELSFEEANDPFTVMGISINYNLLKSLFLGLVSLAFALGQTLLNK